MTDRQKDRIRQMSPWLWIYEDCAGTWHLREHSKIILPEEGTECGENKSSSAVCGWG